MYLLSRNKYTLKSFCIENNIFKYEDLVEYCGRHGLEPCSRAIWKKTKKTLPLGAVDEMTPRATAFDHRPETFDHVELKKYSRLKSWVSPSFPPSAYDYTLCRLTPTIDPVFLNARELLDPGKRKEVKVIINIWPRLRELEPQIVKKIRKSLNPSVDYDDFYHSSDVVQMTSFCVHDCKFQGPYREFKKFLTSFYFDHGSGDFNPSRHPKKKKVLTAMIAKKSELIYLCGKRRKQPKGKRQELNFLTITLTFLTTDSHFDRIAQEVRRTVVKVKRRERVTHSSSVGSSYNLIHADVFSTGRELPKFKKLVNFIADHTEFKICKIRQ
tara:strand:+ start:1548 stop:2525 length:978 start_codon:yes stop_codon:yes gene_type:complete